MNEEYELKDIFVVLVIYNKHYRDSKTIQVLRTINDINIIVIDNSTKQYGNAAIENEYGFMYISMEGNKGLPKAYNAGINLVEKKHKLICLFDDDTELPRKYFDIILKYVNSTNGDVFLPIVKDSLGLLSPSIMKNLYCHRATDVNMLNNDNLSAINSGMCIKSELFKDYKYDENMFLDFVDHDFMRTMKSKNKNFIIMKDNELFQDFSLVSDSKEKAKVRFKILKKDLNYFYRGHKIYYHYVMIKRRLIMCYIYKSLGMLFW